MLHLDTAARWYLLGLLVGGTAVSLAGNLKHASMFSSGGTFAMMWFAVPPLALPVAVHAAGVIARQGSAGWLQRGIAAVVAAIAGGAFYASFLPLRDLTAAFGAPSGISVAFPLIVDALAVIATVALVLDTPPAEEEAEGAEPVFVPESAGAVEVTYTAEAHAEPVTMNVPAEESVDTEPIIVAPAPAPVTPTAPAVLVDGNVQALAEAIYREGVVKATVQQIATVLAMTAAGESGRAASRATGLHTTTVARILAAVPADPAPELVAA